MIHRSRHGKLNLKVLLALIGAVVFLGASAVAVRHFHRKNIAEEALNKGLAAFEREDWQTAGRELRTYLAYGHKEDVAILRKYADAHLSVEPVEITNRMAAIDGYRRLMNLRPKERSAYEKLARLYSSVGNFSEVRYVAEKRLERAPDDPQAKVWLCRALVMLDRQKEARKHLQALVHHVEHCAEAELKPEYLEVFGLRQAVERQAEATTDARDEVLHWLDGKTGRWPQGTTQPALPARWVEARAWLAEKKGVPVGDDADVLKRLEVLMWLDRAIQRFPRSAMALAQRAAFFRGLAVRMTTDRDAPEVPGLQARDLWKGAGSDLADAHRLIGSDGVRPTALLGIAIEWMMHGELDRAEEALDAAGKLPKTAQKQHFVDLREWEIGKLGCRTELALRRLELLDGAVKQADDLLGRLDAEKHRRYRSRVLPDAIRLYAAVGRLGEPETRPSGKQKAGAPTARSCLREYDELRKVMQSKPSPAVAYLEATIARAAGQWGTVVDKLEPQLGEYGSGKLWGPRLYRLLHDAYVATGQGKKALAALERLREFRPPELARGLDAKLATARSDLRAAREHALRGAREEMIKAARRASKGAGEALALLGAKPSVPQPLRLPTVLLRVEADLLRLQGGDQGAPSAADLLATLGKHRQAPPAGGGKLSDPNQLSLRLHQATIESYAGDDKKARQTLRDAVEQCEKSMPARLVLARLQSQDQRLDDAEAMLREARDEDPNAPAPWLRLAGIRYIRAGAAMTQPKTRLREAKVVLEEGLKVIQGTQRKRPLVRALAQLEMQDANEAGRAAALERLRGWVTKDGKDVPTRELLIDMELLPRSGGGPLSADELRQREARAQELIDQIRQLEGSAGVRWRWHQARLWLAGRQWRGRRGEIIKHLKLCHEAYPEWAGPALRLAALHRNEGSHKEAETVYRKTFAANPASREVAEALAQFLLDRGRADDAKTVLGQLRGSERARSAARYSLALREGDADRALSELGQIQQDGQEDLGGLLRKARLTYVSEANYDQAMAYVKRAKELMKAPRRDTDTKQAALGIADVEAWLLLEEKRFEEARKVVDRVVRQWAGEDSMFLVRRFQASFLENVYHRRLAGAADLDKAGKPKEAEEARKIAAKAREEAEQAFRRLPESKGAAWPGEGHWRLAAFCASTRQTDEAIEAARRGSGAYPENLVLGRLLAGLLIDRSLAPDREQAAAAKDRREAAEVLARSLTHHPEDAGLIFLQARLELSRTDQAGQQEAERLLRKAIELEPTAVGVHLVHIDLALGRGEFGEAQRRALSALEKAPGDNRLRLIRADVARRLGDLDTALNALDQVIRDEPGHTVARVMRAGVHRERKDLDAAEADLEKLENQFAKQGADANSYPRYKREHILLLSARDKHGEIVREMSEYTARKDADAGTIDVAAGQLASTKQHRAEGRKLYEHLCATWPKLPHGYFGLAWLAYQEGKMDEAESRYRDVLLLDPNNPRALNDLAWILAVNRGKPKEALPLADRGIRADPRSRNLHDTRARILTDLGRLREAHDEYRMCVDLSERDSAELAKSLLRLGRVCVRQKDCRTAEGHLKRAEKIDKDSKRKALDNKQRQELYDLLAHCAG